MPSLDIFNDDAFSLTQMTKAINDTPHQPGRLGQLGLFSEDGITTTSFFIEKEGTTINLVPAGERGGPARPVTADKRSIVQFRTVHLPQHATIGADEIQGIRAFDGESELETVQNVVNKRLRKMRRNIDTTLEWQRIGAIKGQILDANGTDVLLDLWTQFGVSQQTHSLELDQTGTKVRKEVLVAKRLVESALGGIAYTGLRVLCGPGFFDALISHGAVEGAFDRWQSGEFLRDDVRGGFPFAGVWWEEYRGQVGSTKFIADDDAYMVPEGVPDLFVTNFAPADYMETANTIGLPYYAKQEPLRMNKGIEIEAQSNPISICTRPRAVVKLTKT